jgi:hypothetical protein
MNPDKSQSLANGPANDQPVHEPNSEIISRMVGEVWMFHWKTTAVAIPVALAAIGWFAKDLPNVQWTTLFVKEKPASYLALASVLLVGLYLVWRTFSSVTLWKLNREARAYDPQFRNFLDDKTRLYYNIIAVAAIEGALMLYGLCVLVFFWLTPGGASYWWYISLSLASFLFLFAIRFWVNGHLAVSGELRSLQEREAEQNKNKGQPASIQKAAQKGEGTSPHPKHSTEHKSAPAKGS